MERKVGEIIKYGRAKLQVVKNPSCSECYFVRGFGCYFVRNNRRQSKLNNIENDFVGQCSAFCRSDGESVIFKKI